MKQLTLLTITFIATILAANAQFIDKSYNSFLYSGTNNSTYLDLDNDGLDDFCFLVNGGTTFNVQPYVGNNNAYLSAFAADNNKVYIVGNNTPINNSINVSWLSNTIVGIPYLDKQYCSSFYYSGFQTQLTTYHGGFIPVKVNGMLGFVFFDIDGAGNLHIIGSRIATTAGISLNTNLSTGIINLSNDDNWKIVLQNNNQLEIQSTNIQEGDEVVIHTVDGKLIMQQALKNENSIQLNLTTSTMIIVTVIRKNSAIARRKLAVIK
jgi:hypothetical protein